jgi:polyisoprenoid-binding protein YceI
MKNLLFLMAMTITAVGYGQKYISEKTFVSFYSHAAIEDIKADNAKASSVFDTATGDIAFSVPIKDFVFAKTLMQEHFNEKYMETEKFPKSTFQGKLLGFDAAKKGPQQVKAQGKLTLHGVARTIDVPGTVEVQGNRIQMKSVFVARLDDYKITRPELMFQKIAEQVDVTIDFTFKPYEK